MRDGIAVALEHFYHPVFVDRPIQNEMVLLGGYNNSIIVVRVRELLYLVGFHEQFSVALGVGCQIYIEGVGVRYVQDLSIVGEVQTCDVTCMLFYYFCRL